MTSVHSRLDLLQCAIHMKYIKLRPENKAPSLQEEDSPCGWVGICRCEWSERIAASEGEYERRLEDTEKRIAAEEPKWSITPEAKARFQKYKERLVTLKAIWHKIHRDVERRSVGNPGALKEANDKLFAAKVEEQTI